jgi:hypothetical protein
MSLYPLFDTSNLEPMKRSFTLPGDLLISALTPPILAGILGAQATADLLRQLGLISEELFRGERLPTLSMAISPEKD